MMYKHGNGPKNKQQTIIELVKNGGIYLLKRFNEYPPQINYNLLI